MTSALAEVVLGVFIPLSIGVFFVMRPFSAALLVLLGADMFLPMLVSFKLPMMPSLTKSNLPYLCVLVGCLLRCPSKVTRLPKEKWFNILAVAAVIGGALTALTNHDSLTYLGREGEVVTPAMTLNDGMFLCISELFPACLAFYLGYALAQQRKDTEKLLSAVAIAGLVYSPFAIFEMRMSPLLHGRLYGYGVGQFEQTIRWGGWRPVVFMAHGLAVAKFFMISTMAFFLLLKRKRTLLGLPTHFLFWFQALVLILCRSAGAVILALVGILIMGLFKPRRQLLLTSILAIGTFAYPLLRAAEIFPVSTFLDAAGALQGERRDSLAFRFANEDLLLEHARQRLAFGWGVYGRNGVRDAAGYAATTDGYWILILGMAGIAGFTVAFGVLLWPVVSARHRLLAHSNADDKRLIAGYTVIITLATADLIPNGMWSVFPYIMAGVLARRLRNLDLTPSDSPDGRPGVELAGA